MSLRRLAMFVSLVAVAALVAGQAYFKRWLATPLAIDGRPLSIEVARGATLSSVARELAGRGALAHPRWLVAYARYTGQDARMRAGEYAVAPGTTPRALLELFTSGAVVQHSVTIVEGWTFREMRQALGRADALQHTLAGRSDEAVMSALGEPGQAPEGLFFPDTYVYAKGTTELEVLRQARARMQRELDAAWAKRKADLPLQTPYEALVLASIVEKETANAAERARIAGVFVQRLRIGMRLQTDPTVIYGLGTRFDGNLRRADLERDGPYNTYTREGLPPTPIALPGRAALRAAVQPDERGELYFVATGLPDGSHRFSRTLAEHNAAVAEYLARYRQQQSKGK